MYVDYASIMGIMGLLVMQHMTWENLVFYLKQCTTADLYNNQFTLWLASTYLCTYKITDIILKYS